MEEIGIVVLMDICCGDRDLVMDHTLLIIFMEKFLENG